MAVFKIVMNLTLPPKLFAHLFSETFFDSKVKFSLKFFYIEIFPLVLCDTVRYKNEGLQFLLHMSSRREIHSSPKTLGWILNK